MLAALITSCVLAADPGLSVEPLGPARPGGVLRVAVHLVAMPAVPLHLEAELLDGSARLASAKAELPQGSDGASVAVLVLFPSRSASGPLRVRATASWSSPGLPNRMIASEAAVSTPGSVLNATIAAIAKLRTSGRQDPLPWLWAEQISELSASGASAASIGEVSLLGFRLIAWLDAVQPQQAHSGRNDLALRDPVDGSVQPFRLHLPSGAGPFPVLALLPAASPERGKTRWPDPDPRLIDAALDASIAVVVCYPAGDRAWDGAARRRIALNVAAAAACAPLDATRGAIVGRTAPGGLPFVVHNLPEQPDAAWCRSILGPAKPIVPGNGWADAPFSIIVGTAEHAAAVQANRAIAEGLRKAYAAHAHAVVELIDDRAELTTLDGRNLVLIGNPRSNRVLASLGLDLPYRWDHRMMTGPEGSVLRATMPSLVIRSRLPNGYAVLIVDGPVPMWGDELPLREAAAGQ